MIKNLIFLIFAIALGWILLFFSPEKQEPELMTVNVEEEVAMYRPGIYIGRGRGFVSDIVVEVEIISNVDEPYFSINRIEVLEAEELERYFKPAKTKVVDAVINKQTVEVDVITEATRSRDGLLEAIKDALNKAHKSG